MIEVLANKEKEVDVAITALKAKDEQINALSQSEERLKGEIKGLTNTVSDFESQVFHVTMLW